MRLNALKTPFAILPTVFFALGLFLAAFAPAPCAAFASEREIIVAAAADLSFAVKEIAASFEKETGIKIKTSFGSTGMISKQIREGAPFDVFFAADVKYINALEKDGFASPGTAQLYAQGRIVLAVNKTAGVEISSLKDLLKPEIRRIAIANPSHAPYGKAAVEALKAGGVLEGVKNKLVYGENIRQALQYIQTGNAQAGIVALSVADVPEITYMPIDPSLHNPINQAVCVIKATKELSASKEFIGYVNGKKGRLIMKKYGFLLPGEF